MKFGCLLDSLSYGISPRNSGKYKNQNVEVYALDPKTKEFSELSLLSQLCGNETPQVLTPILPSL